MLLIYMTDQSELLHKRKFQHILCRPEDLGNTLDAQTFTNLKSYIFRDQDDENVSDPANHASGFALCQNTQNRPNRTNVNLSMCSTTRQRISRHGFYWNQKKNDLIEPCKQFEACKKATESN
jgi:hypothetical protein